MGITEISRMKKKIPTLSIVLPTHYRSKELVRSLESIIRNIEVDYEIIVVSDVRCLQTRDVLARYLRDNDVYLECPHRMGPAMSRNIALEKVRSPYVLIFDDDDEIPCVGYMDFLNQAFSRQHCVSYSDVVIVQEDRVQGVLTDIKPEKSDISMHPVEGLFIKNFIFTQATIFPAAALKGKRQDVHMRSLEDWEFLLQVMNDCEFVYAQGLGAIIYKDYVNSGNRRGTTRDARNFEVILDSLYVYRRWRAPSRELKELRSAILRSNNILIEPEFL